MQNNAKNALIQIQYTKKLNNTGTQITGAAGAVVCCNIPQSERAKVHAHSFLYIYRNFSQERRKLKTRPIKSRDARDEDVSVENYSTDLKTSLLVSGTRRHTSQRTVHSWMWSRDVHTALSLTAPLIIGCGGHVRRR